MKKPELEKLLLGSILNNKDILIQTIDTLNVDMFTDHRREWMQFVLDQTLSGENISYHGLATQTEDQHRKELDQIFFEFSNRDGVVLAEDLRELYLSAKTADAIRKANNGLVSGDKSTQVQERLFDELNDLRATGGTQGKNYQRYEAAKKNLYDNGQYFQGGSPVIAQKTGGWPAGMNVIAARPGMGKTTQMLWEIIYSIRQGKAVAFYSLEMSTELILTRMACYWCGYNANDIHRFSDDDKKRIENAIDEIKAAPLFIRDLQDFSGKVEDLSADVFVLKHREGVEMVVIDYLQLMDCYNSFKMKTLDRVGRVSTYVARMGNKLQLPILMLSQLSRSVEIRGGAKRPIMSDLRESGQIEQDAVTITFIYRPEYYNILEDETGRSLKGLTELIIAKHRIDGSRTGKKIELWFNSGTGEFTGDDPSDFHMGSQPDPFTNPISQKPDINTHLPF